MPFPKRGTAGFYKATSFINKRHAARKLKGVGGPSGTKRGAPTDGEETTPIRRSRSQTPKPPAKPQELQYRIVLPTIQIPGTRDGS